MQPRKILQCRSCSHQLTCSAHARPAQLCNSSRVSLFQSRAGAPSSGCLKVFACRPQSGQKLLHVSQVLWLPYPSLKHCSANCSAKSVPPWANGNLSILPAGDRVQEADLQRHRARLLLGKGRIEEIAGACLQPQREHTFEDSVRAFEVWSPWQAATRLLRARLRCCSGRSVSCLVACPLQSWLQSFSDEGEHLERVCCCQGLTRSRAETRDMKWL